MPKLAASQRSRLLQEFQAQDGQLNGALLAASTVSADKLVEVYALQASLANYAPLTALDEYAKTADLDDYLLEADVPSVPGDIGAATAAQGALADTAIQPADLGSAAYVDTSAFASAGQGLLADTALQPSSPQLAVNVVVVTGTLNGGASGSVTLTFDGDGRLTSVTGPP